MDFILDNEYTSFIVHAIGYLVMAFVLFVIGRVTFQFFHRDIKVVPELVEKDNFAFSLSYVGYYVGLLMAIGSAIVGPSNGLMQDLNDIAVYGFLAIILLNLSALINDKVLLRKFSVKKEIIEDRNAGTGIIEAANFIGSGLIIFGAVTGSSANLISGIVTAIAFWLIGQVIMILTTRVYNMITPYDIHEHIEKDNVAVGIGFAGAMLAIANLIGFAIRGDFLGWSDMMIDVALEVGIGLLFLPLARLMTDKILLPGRNLTDEIVNQDKPNLGAALVEAFAYVGGSILITWCI